MLLKEMVMSDKLEYAAIIAIIFFSFIAGVWVGSRNNPTEIHYIPIPQKTEYKILS